MTPTLRATVAALAVSTTAGAADATQARFDAFQKEAAAQRAAQRLERGDPRLLAQYPPPALAQPEGAEAPVACPGQEVQVKLVGRLVKGSLVQVLSDDVQVSGEVTSESGWEAKLKVSAAAPPGDVLLRVTSPVSGAWRATRLLDVGCRHRWVLDVGTGEQLTATTAWPRGANTTAQAEGTWTRAGQPLGAVRLTVRGGDGAYTFERQESAEEARAHAALLVAPDYKVVAARAAEAQAKVNACSKGPPAEQQACLKAGGEALARTTAEQEALRQKALAGLAPRFGCDVLKVKRGAEGLTGRAEGCRGERRQASVTGAVSAAK